MLTELKTQNYWQEFKVGEEIPGSTRVPVAEIKKHLLSQGFELSGNGKNIADIGSGSGRSTDVLAENFPYADVYAFDLCRSGLKETTSTDKKIQASVDKISFASNSVDYLSMCGVMTNLVGENIEQSISLRVAAASEINRTLREGGMAIVSDFTRPHFLSGYNVNYKRHALITQEEGTIAVFDPSSKTTFSGLSDEEVAKLSSSKALQRFAHHYTYEEMIMIFKLAGMKPISYSVELGSTPSGTPIDTIVLSLIKS